MRKAARAIIIEDNKMLLMHREKEGHSYYTLVGGKINDNEDKEEALKREVKEETGLDIIECKLVFIEEHPEPYNEQYTYLCKVAPHTKIGLQLTSEEALMNKAGINMHTPLWIEVNHFKNIPFRTVQLQSAIRDAITNGFPEKSVKI